MFTISPDEWQIESNTLASLFEAGEISLEQWFHAAALLGDKPPDPPADPIPDPKPDINAIPPWGDPPPPTADEIARDKEIVENARRARENFAKLREWLNEPIPVEAPTKEEHE